MILVDGVTEYETKLKWKKWSHMVSTESLDELMHFAARLDLKRTWLQVSSFVHFDITPPKRVKALKLGALEVTSRALLFCNFDYANKRQVRPCSDCAGIEGLGRPRDPVFFKPGCVRCDLSLYLPLTPSPAAT